MKTILTSAPLALAALMIAAPANAQPMVMGGKLLLTRGVTSVEGGTGAGLATWALIAGNETEDGIGGSAFATYVPLSDYGFTAYGAAVGLFDRVELSYAHHDFDTGDTGVLLGLGDGFIFEQDVYGVKVRLLGNAVYDQDTWLPQVAVGVQYKNANQTAIIGALGGGDDESFDYYIAATKILLNQSLLVNVTARYTEANQFGLLGYGSGDDDYSLQWEASVGYMLNERLLLGAEYRTKPDNLAFADEENAFDVFAAYAINENITLVGGYVDLGSIATFDDQNGAYLSVQVGL